MNEIQPSPGGMRVTLASMSFAAYLLLAGGLLLAVLWPFLTALLLAAVVAVWLAPAHERFLGRWHRPRLGATLLVVALLVGVIGPLIGLSFMLVHQLRNMTGDLAAHIARPLEIPAIQAGLQWLAVHWEIPIETVPDRIEASALQVFQELASAASRNLGSVAGGIANVFLQGTVFLFALFVFLLQRQEILARFKRLSPLEDSYEDRLIEIFRGFSKGLVLGGVLTSAIQGVVATLAFWVVGVPQAVFWGVLTALFSVIPVVGSALIWVPISIGLWIEGRPQAALGLFLYNVFVTGTVDNIARPFLIGQGANAQDGTARMGNLMLFLTVIGGLLVFGFPGLLIGPVAAAFFFALAEILEQRSRGLSRPAAAAATGGTATAKDSGGPEAPSPLS
jgi:predicted PurR-regulated permease PerM